MDVDISAISNVITFALHEVHHAALLPAVQEMARTLTNVKGIGPVKGNFGGGNAVRAIERVERFPSLSYGPIVIGLIRSNRGLKQIGRLPAVVADNEYDVSLLP